MNRSKTSVSFYLSWIVSSLAMFCLSYAWHGLLLNDLLKINYPLDVFLLVSGLVYLGIGLIITLVTFFAPRIKDSFKYGIAAGGAIGIFVYAIAFVVGISFYPKLSLTMVAIDVSWQCLEQGIGGLTSGLIYRISYRKSRALA